MIVAPRLTQQLQQRRVYFRALLFIALLLASSLIISLLSLSAEAQSPSSEAASLESSRRSYCELRDFRIMNASTVASAVRTIAALDARGELRFSRSILLICPGSGSSQEAELLDLLRAGFLSGNLREEIGVRPLIELLGAQGLREVTPAALASSLIIAIAELRQFEKNPQELAAIRRNPARLQQVIADKERVQQTTAPQRDQLINGTRERPAEPSTTTPPTLPGLSGGMRPALLSGRSNQDVARSRELGARLNTTNGGARQLNCEDEKRAGRLPADTVCN